MKRIGAMPWAKSPDRAITLGLRKAGSLLQKATVKTLTTGKRTGRIYIIRGRKHQASAAGEAPAKLTGRLAKSVGHDVRGKRLTVGEREPYAGWLERGTSRMAARPHLLVTFERNQKAVTQELRQSVERLF